MMEGLLHVNGGRSLPLTKPKACSMHRSAFKEIQRNKLFSDFIYLYIVRSPHYIKKIKFQANYLT